MRFYIGLPERCNICTKFERVYGCFGLPLFLYCGIFLLKDDAKNGENVHLDKNGMTAMNVVER